MRCSAEKSELMYSNTTRLGGIPKGAKKTPPKNTQISVLDIIKMSKSQNSHFLNT